MKLKKLKKFHHTINKKIIIDKRKFAFFLPNVFTALNLACGFLVIILTVSEKFYYAGLTLVLGSVFDMVDGRIARLTGTQSNFGEQFDSMSDVVTFGVAPSIMIYYRFCQGYGRLGLVVAFLFLLCSALRLARFNANIDRVHPNFFQGLPTPVAALALGGYVLLSTELLFINDISLVAMAYSVFYSFLMISNIPFCSFKKSEWMRMHKKRVLIIIFLIIAVTFIYEQFMIPAVILIYVISSLIYFFTHRWELKDVFDWEND